MNKAVKMLIIPNSYTLKKRFPKEIKASKTKIDFKALFTVTK